MPHNSHRRIAALAVALAASALLSSCAQTAQSARADELTPDQLALLDRNLGGKVAGEPVSCISSVPSTQTIRVSDSILLYRVSGRLVYRNDLRSSCIGLARDNDVIVSVVHNSGPCRGDILRLVDRTSGISGGSCVLGEFTPYRTPRDAS